SLNAQVQRAVESREVGERTFGEVRTQYKAELEKLSASVGDAVRKAIDAGNKQRGVDAALSVSDTVFLGFIGDEPGWLGFTIAAKVGAKNSTESSRKVAAGIVTPVNGRLLYLYANSDYRSEADRQWAETTVQAWRNAVIAANPRVEGPSATIFSF